QKIANAEVIRAVYEEVRTHMPRGQATSVVLPAVGYLNGVCLRWHFRAETAPAPHLIDVFFWTTPSLATQLKRLEHADLVVIAEPGMQSSLIDEGCTANWHDKLIAHLDHDARFQLCSAVPAWHGKRVLLYERRGPFSGCSPSKGLHPRSQNMVATL